MNWWTKGTAAFTKFASAGVRMPALHEGADAARAGRGSPPRAGAGGPRGTRLARTAWRRSPGCGPPKVTVYLRVSSIPFLAMTRLMLAWKWLIVPRGKPIMTPVLPRLLLAGMLR